MNAAFTTLIRLAHVYSAFEVARVHAERKSTQRDLNLESKISRAGFCVRNGHLIQRPCIQASLILLHTVFQLGVWLTVALVSSEISSGAEFAFGALVIAFYVVPIGCLACKIIRINDGLYLRLEVTATAMVSVFVGVLYVVLRVASPGTNFATIAVVLICPYLLIVPVIGFPLYKSYVWEKETRRYRSLSLYEQSKEIALPLKQPSSTGVGRRLGKSISKKVEAMDYVQVRKGARRTALGRVTLQQVLAHPAGTEAFIEFCKLELNHESVLFYIDVRDYLAGRKSNEMTEQEAVTRAIALYKAYIEPGAQLQVNIDHLLQVNFVRAGLSNATETDFSELDFVKLDQAFENAHEEVFQLMAADSFVRFLRHKLCLRFMQITSTARGVG